MANLHDCLQVALDAGELKPEFATRAQQEYQELVDRYSTAMPIHQAQATAAKHVKEAISRSARSRRHLVLSQLQASTRIKTLIEGADDPALAVRNLIEWSEGSGFKGESIEKLAQGLVNSVTSELRDVLRATGQNMAGVSRNKALLTEVIDELHGGASGNPEAARMAQAVASQRQRLRKLFNAYGGDIGDLADYGVPHTHDANRLRKAGFDAWADAVTERLDWTRIEDLSTGAPFTVNPGDLPDPSAARAFLRRVYDGIVTHGFDRREPSMRAVGKSLANRHAEARVLHFKSGTDWMEYNKSFGQNDPFTAMISSLHQMAREVSMMRVLGPNPNGGLEYAKQVAEKKARLAGDDALANRVRQQGSLAQTMLSHFTGAANASDWEGWARFFSGTRKVLTSIQLGSALLSSASDLATMSVAAKAVGMNPANVVSRHVELMASSATRETAAQMGYVAETLADAGAVSARFTGETMAPEFAERVSGFTMRASGLSYWTDMARTAFRMEFAGFLAANADRALSDVDEPLRVILQGRGITSDDWDKLRDPSALFTAPNGSKFLATNYWRNATGLDAAEAEGLAGRLQMIIEEQMEFAVPSANLEARARIVGDSDPGSISGVLLRSTFMYKSFGTSLMLNQYRRFMAIPTPMGRAQYAAKISAGLLLMGAVAVQLKEMAKGRDPRPMDQKKFWAAATLQGGGFGIFGDFFAAETSRAGGGIAETIAGPVVGFASDIVRPIASNVARVAEGKDPLIGRDLANFVRYNTPVASSLWYERLAFDRLVGDTLQLALDPEAVAAMQRQEKTRLREYGTSTFWPRGALAPDRLPDLSNALGGAQP